jgi:hypothetical protein
VKSCLIIKPMFVVALSTLLVACGPLNMINQDAISSNDSEANSIGRPPGVGVKYAKYSGNAGDIEFANTICTRGLKPLQKSSSPHPDFFPHLADSDKNRCLRVIDNLCKHIDVQSEEVEAIPRWRPEGSPASYLIYLSKNGLSHKVKNHFTCAMYSILVEANTRVQMERLKMYEIFKRNQEGKIRSGSEQFHSDIAKGSLSSFVADMGDRYEPGADVSMDLPWNQGAQKSRWIDIFKRIDTVPIPFILAVGGNESGWGIGGRWGTQAINFFGRQTSRGVKATQTCVAGGTCLQSSKYPEVGFIKYYKFETAIDDQVRYLNRHSIAEGFRNARFSQRLRGRAISTAKLASGISGYSSGTGEYARLIPNAISVVTNVIKYDALFANDVIDSKVLQDLAE